MEFFPDGAYVRLQGRLSGRYFGVDHDGVGVCRVPSCDRDFLDTAWRVHRVVRGRATRVLLQNAAYGGYLAITPGEPRPLRHGWTLKAYDTPEQDDVLWKVLKAVDWNWSGCVVLQNVRFPIANLDREMTINHYFVEDIPLRDAPPDLPLPPTDLAEPSSSALCRLRRIEFVRADDQGSFDQLAMSWFIFYGESLLHLRVMLAISLNESTSDITLCMRPGSQGRLIPMIADLPHNTKPMFIVVLATDSPAALALQYPDIDAPAIYGQQIAGY